VTQVQAYSSTGILLRTIITCYNGGNVGCAVPSIPVFAPILQQDVYTYAGGLPPSLVETKYDGNGNVTDVTEYDFGGSGSSFENRTDITYGSWNGGSCAAIGSYINNRVCESKTISGTGAVMADTRNTYDSHGNLLTTASLVSGGTSGGLYLSKSFTYNPNGTVATITDVNGTLTTVSNAQCSNLLPTSITTAGVTTQLGWNCNGPAVTSVTDPNKATNGAAYADPLWRLTQSTDPLGNNAYFSYTPTSATSSFTFNRGQSVHAKTETVDSLGRPHLNQVQQGPGSGNYDSVEADYYVSQMKRTGILPYVGSLGQTNSSGPGVTTTYDALGRTLKTIDNNGGYTSYLYTNNDVLVTVGPAPSGENVKQRQLEYNGLGWLTSVCEITSTANGGTACGQNQPATGFLTWYGYDAVGHLVQVSQGSQYRTFTYDDLGRITGGSDPESAGGFAYTYDSDATCGTYTGDLVKTVDAVGNTVCMAYDAIHRLTSVLPVSGPYSTNNTYSRVLRL